MVICIHISPQKIKKERRKMKRASTASCSLESTENIENLKLCRNPHDNVSWDCPDDIESPRQILEEEDKYPEIGGMEALRRQSVASAEKALKFYNKKYHTNYELVAALNSNAGLYDRIWIHCNFEAKPKTTPTGSVDSSTKLFFAELIYPPATSLSLSPTVNCRILRGRKHGHCESCGDTIKHPSHGFRMGRKQYRPYALRSRLSGDY